MDAMVGTCVKGLGEQKIEEISIPGGWVLFGQMDSLVGGNIVL